VIQLYKTKPRSQSVKYFVSRSSRRCCREKYFFRLNGRRHRRVLSGRSGRKNRSHGARPEQREVEVLTNVSRRKSGNLKVLLLLLLLQCHRVERYTKHWVSRVSKTVCIISQTHLVINRWKIGVFDLYLLSYQLFKNRNRSAFA